MPNHHLDSVENMPKSFKQKSLFGRGQNQQGLKAGSELKNVAINLDHDPAFRFVEVGKTYATQIQAMRDIAMAEIPESMHWVFFILRGWYFFMEFDIFMEYKGLADGAGLATYEVMMINFMYEFKAYCTSIVAHHQNGEEMVHGRNFDIQNATLYRGSVYNAYFVRKGIVLYQGIMVAGLTGVWTGYKAGEFSITINSRSTTTPLGQFANNLGLFFGILKPSQMTRSIFEKAATYDDAVFYLKYTPITAPVYYIIAGTKANQGMIIAKDRLIYSNTMTVNASNADNWFLVQTNHDTWNPTPVSDQGKFQYATDQVKYMTKPYSNKENMMYYALSGAPVYNEQTLYSTVMNVKQKIIYTQVY